MATDAVRKIMFIFIIRPILGVGVAIDTITLIMGWYHGIHFFLPQADEAKRS